MKMILLALVVIAALLLGHNYIQTGKVGFNVSLSDTERTLRNLDERLDDALRGYRVAGRATAVGGLAPDSSVESLGRQVESIEDELADLRERISDSELEPQIRRLEERIREAKTEMGL